MSEDLKETPAQFLERMANTHDCSEMDEKIMTYIMKDIFQIKEEVRVVCGMVYVGYGPPTDIHTCAKAALEVLEVILAS